VPTGSRIWLELLEEVPVHRDPHRHQGIHDLADLDVSLNCDQEIGLVLREPFLLDEKVYRVPNRDLDGPLERLG
jgi:hypothetical protein